MRLVPVGRLRPRVRGHGPERRDQGEGRILDGDQFGDLLETDRDVLSRQFRVTQEDVQGDLPGRDRRGRGRLLGAAVRALHFAALGGRPLGEGGAPPAGHDVGRPARADPSEILSLQDRGRRRVGDRREAARPIPSGRPTHPI